MQSGVILDLASLAETDLKLDNLLAALPDWQTFSASTLEQAEQRIRGKQVVVTNKVPITEKMMRENPGLKLVCVTATGTNNIDLEVAQKYGVAVSNVVAYATDSVVQHVFAMMLSHFTSMPTYTQAVKNGEWSQAEQFCLLDYPVLELRNMTLGIIGFGELGQGVAKIAEAFGMQVLVAQREGGEAQEGRLPIDELLPQVDVLSLHVPLADNTHHLLDERRLRLMKPSALVINTARGAVIDNAALAKVLREGVLGGAALDVLDQEPPPLDHVLLQPDIPNLTITPHSAWAGRQARQNVVDETLRNIQAFIAGESRNRVA